MKHPKKGTQAAKVLKALLDAKGEWLNGRFFLRELYLSQYHARIWDLENRFGWTVEHGEADTEGFKSYRIDPASLPKKIEYRVEMRNGQPVAVPTEV